MNFRSLLVTGNAENLETDGDAGDAATVTAFGETGANNVDGGAAAADLAVGADDTGITTALVPVAAGNVDSATETDPTTFGPFFESAPYVGAVEDDADNWYVGWTFGL